jgi:mono/diheme cytochrome c family protein
MGNCLPAARAGGAPDIDAGQVLADRLCARCHAIGREGKSPFEPAPPFRTFASKWPLENLEEALAEGIVVGHEAMPAFALTPRQILDLIAYMDTLQ